MAIRRATAAGALLIAGIAFAGCTGGPVASEASPSPSSSSSPTETPAPGAAADDDAALLPIPAEDIASWAETAVPDGATPGHVLGLSGWLSDNSSAHQKSTMQSLDPGVYQAQIACRGEGEITVTVGELDGEGSTEPVSCTNQTIAFDVTTTRTGMQVLLDLEGAPSIYAMSFLRMDGVE